MAKERVVIELEENDQIKLAHIARYEFAQKYIKNRSVIDVACGSGYGSRILKEGGSKKVVGIDNSVDAIEYAERNYSGTEIEFDLDDALNLSRYGKADIIVSLETIEHLREPEFFLREVAKTMFHDGSFIVSTPCREGGKFGDVPQNRFHYQEWSLSEFEKLLKSYFGNVELFGQHLHFPRRWLPFSRTALSIMSRLVCPQIVNHMYKLEVREFPKVVRLRLIPSFIVGVCWSPKLVAG
jgi:SAM-dependent methyltransferase